jgi:uncharacterized protein involved in outer membrane biogenesis
MKTSRKVLLIILGVVIALVVCITLFIQIFGNSLLKTGIESAASKTLNVGVNIDNMDFSIFGGSVGFQNLVIDNPPGYKYEKLLEVGDARIAVNLGSLLEDTVNIKEIKLDGVNVVLEQKGVTSNNLQDVIKSIPEGEPQDEKEKAGKKLHIDDLEITNIVVKAKLLPVPGKVDSITLKLNPIKMTDLGSDNKLDTAKLSGKILLAIATGVAEQGAGILPDDLTNAMKTALGKTAKLGKAATEQGQKLLKEGTDTGKNIVEGVTDLLKPKKKD